MIIAEKEVLVCVFLCFMQCAQFNVTCGLFFCAWVQFRAQRGASWSFRWRCARRTADRGFCICCTGAESLCRAFWSAVRAHGKSVGRMRSASDPSRTSSTVERLRWLIYTWYQVKNLNATVTRAACLKLNSKRLLLKDVWLTVFSNGLKQWFSSDTCH